MFAPHGSEHLKNHPIFGRYLLHHTPVIEYFMSEQAGPITGSPSSFDSLVDLLARLQFMNIQKVGEEGRIRGWEIREDWKCAKL